MKMRRIESSLAASLVLASMLACNCCVASSLQGDPWTMLSQLRPPVPVPTNVPKSFWSKPHPELVPLWAREGQPWLKEAWTGNDGPYAAAQAKIRHQIQSGAGTLDLVKKYRSVAISHETNPLAVFDCACAMYYYNRSLDLDESVARDQMIPVVHLVALPASPMAYTYDRMRFLIVAVANVCAHETDLGYRLLQKDKSDGEVCYQLSTITREAPANPPGQAYVRNIDNVKTAVKLAETFVATSPRTYYLYRSLTISYYWLYNMSKDVKYAKLMAYSANRYRQFAPANAAWQPWVDWFNAYADNINNGHDVQPPMPHDPKPPAY